MFLVHFGGTTHSEVKRKTIWEPSWSHKNDHSLLTRSETNLGDLKMRQNTARYLFRRSINKSGNKTIGSDKGLQINSTTDSNSTAMKLTGEDFLTKTNIPPFPNPPSSIPPTHLGCSKFIESCENKCSNETRFVSSDRAFVPLCSCDTSCNGIFMDCCSDYTKHCGSNTIVPSDPVYEARSYLQCESKLNLSLEPCEQPDGVWMIKQCPMQWSDDVIRRKCEAPSMFLDNRAYGTLVPVYSGISNLTYRNQYCAICHNVTSYEFWELTFREEATPPSHFNKETLMTFISSNLRYFRGIRPKYSFNVRYCYFASIVKSCPNSWDFDNTQCVNGTVEIVHSSDVVYRNRACSSCHDVKSPCSIETVSPGGCFVLPGIISRAVDLQDYGVVKVTKVCPEGQVYDPYISTCRSNYQPLLLNSSVDSYKIIMAVLRYASTPRVNESQLLQTIARNFNFSKRQVRNVEIATLDDKFIISFMLHLTPLQSLIISSGGVKNPKNLKLWRLLRFKSAFPLILSDGVNLTVFRVKVGRLACMHWSVYQYHDYTMFQDHRLYINKTKVTYEEYEYELSGPAVKPKATVCSKLAPFHIDDSYISLNPSEYTLLPNLTLIYKNSRYDFGEYSYVNGTVYIFVGFKVEHEKSPFFRNRAVLTIVNFPCFILSELFLIALIVTYLLFKELRTLPGKNLLSLAVSLSLTFLFWVFSGEFTDSETMCTALAIATHYFFLVYFTACSVIAYHSCHVFGRGIAVRPSEEEENRRFRIYFLLTWFAPALFVGLFSILDHTGSFAVDYGLVGEVVCFLGTKQAQFVTFITPIAISLFFNVSMFIHVAKRFFKNQRSNSQFLSSELQRKRDRENVLICIRLSTLMGFSWLFLFIHLLSRPKTQVFLYLFVVFVGLQ
ncbi:adhesion G -coupled receptor E4P, partial, partial [Paramuricea clavata]